MIEAELIAVLAARYLAQLPSTWPETTGTSAAQIAGIRADLYKNPPNPAHNKAGKEEEEYHCSNIGKGKPSCTR